MDPRRIALIKPSALGDIVHALPVLSALRARWPSGEITWVVNKSYEPLLAGHPDLTDTLAFDRGAGKRGLLSAVRHALGFARELRRRRFDLVVDLQGLLRSGLMCQATRAPRIVGFANAREGSRFAYTDRVAVPDANRIHAVDRYWRIVEYLDAGKSPKRFHVPISLEARTWAFAELRSLPRPILAVAVGAKWVTKRWPPAHFAELLRPVRGSFVFVGTAEDAAISQEVIEHLNAGRDYTGKTTLPQLAALLDACDIMVGNDTGPLHLAAALGKPCVAPYLCTKIAKHGPYNSFGNCVETTVPCGGSYLKTCPRNMICRPELPPERLGPKLAEALEAWQRTSRSA